jgi:hypothetical protein
VKHSICNLAVTPLNGAMARAVAILLTVGGNEEKAFFPVLIFHSDLAAFNETKLAASTAHAIPNPRINDPQTLARIKAQLTGNAQLRLPGQPHAGAAINRLAIAQEDDASGFKGTLHLRDATHLRHVLLSYMSYYNGTRTHLSLNKDAPKSRAA